MSTETSDHHFSWSDRLGINKILHDAINDCRMTYGTEEYRSKVFSLLHLIPNIREGPKLRDMVTKYKTVTWEKNIEKKLEKWKNDNPSQRDELDIIQSEEEQLRDDLLPDLFDFMYQLLETVGLGFYKSDMSTDQISLTSTNEMEDSTEEK